MTLDKKLVPKEILSDSVILHIALAYFSLSKEMERRTQCPETRGFILSTLRDGAERNQNQIAIMLGFDRTVVHRAIKSMVREGLLCEKKAPTGRGLLVRLTPKGARFRGSLVAARRALEKEIRGKLDAKETGRAIAVLKAISSGVQADA